MFWVFSCHIIVNNPNSLKLDILCFFKVDAIVLTTLCYLCFGMVYFVGLFLRLGHANSLTKLELGFPIAFLICAILRSILIFSLAFYYANFHRTWEIKLAGHFLSQIREKKCSSLTHDYFVYNICKIIKPLDA